MTRRMYSRSNYLRQAAFRRIRRATASIKKPIHNVKDLRANPANRPEDRNCFASSLEFLESLVSHFEEVVEPIGIEPMT